MIRLLLLLSALANGLLGADYQRTQLVIAPDGREGTVHFFRFSAQEAALKIITREKNNLGAAMKKHRCLAGCNGGFFHPNYQPLGEVITDGQKIGSRSLKSSLTSGVVYQNCEDIVIERAKVFYAKENIQPKQLLQAGPFLVEKKQLISGLSPRRLARRTFIATDGKGN